MINFIKCLAEIHDYDVRLASLVTGVIQIPRLSELNKLSYTAYTITKTMLILEEQVISVKMGHNVGGYDMLHNLATNISQGNGFRAWIWALFIYRCEVGIFPVKEDCSSAREAL